ncbi:polyprenol reductase isoform X2 [Linepithema humile]|uniref:polyprenol reductase isoform X2 n=1 Tax=Linepithema humile TaxID=83485 RepID=UPI00351ECEE4
MDINIIRYVFILNSMIILSFGILINCFEPYLPILITRLFRYGKFSIKVQQALVAKLEVPKRWFRHFYIFAGPASTIILCLILYKYLYNGNIPEIVFILLDTSLGTSRKPLISAEYVILAIVIFNIHCWKRAYETCYVNVYSDQKMNILHYLVGHIHYIGTLLCIVGESEGFVKDSRINLSLSKLTVITIIYVTIFLWSSYMQLKTNIILAKLRKNKHGDIVSHKYRIPVDGLFKYTSAPLQFTEIFVYLMLSGILWQASTYHYVTIWVITNQVETAFLSHQWYHDTFKNYPKERKILIPYVW